MNSRSLLIYAALCKSTRGDWPGPFGLQSFNTQRSVRHVRFNEQNKALMCHIDEEMWNKGNSAPATELSVQPTGVERFVSQFLQSFPDLQYTLEACLTEGDLA